MTDLTHASLTLKATHISSQSSLDSEYLDQTVLQNFLKINGFHHIMSHWQEYYAKKLGEPLFRL